MSSALPCLAVKDFAKHQHYRDRRPPWIKLYAALLTDATFLMLPEAAQAQLIKLWVLASQFGDPLPNQPRLLAGKIGTTGRFYLKELIASGFLIPCEQDASAALAEVEEGASAPVRVARETEVRGQSSETTSSSGPTFDASQTELVVLLGSTLLAEQEVSTFLAGLDTPERRRSWVRNLITSLQGGGGPAIQPAAMLSALIDFNLADRQAAPYNGAVFRGFVDRASRPKLEPVQRRSGGDEAARGAVTSIMALIHRDGRSTFIRKAEVDAMGPEISAAYAAVGGADRFIQTEPAKVDWLVKAFGEALRSPGVTNAA